MGVDFKGCNSCGESRYDEYVGECRKCDNSVCTDCLINKGGKTDPFAGSYGIEFDPGKMDEMNKLQNEGGGIFKEDGSPYYSDGEIIEETSIDHKYCPYCSGNEIDDAEMLEYFLKEYKHQYGFTKEEVWAEVKARRNDN